MDEFSGSKKTEKLIKLTSLGIEADSILVHHDFYIQTQSLILNYIDTKPCDLKR